MSLLPDYATLALAMLASGIAGGLLAGMLGVGGGIVVVPVLELALSLLGVEPELRLHVAVATSLATIIPTAISSARTHHARRAVDLVLFRQWAPFMLIGAAFGALAASGVKSHALALVFGCVALLVPDTVRLADSVPKGPLSRLIPLSIGGLSSMMGIGGGTLTVPILTLLNHPVHTAIGTSALLGLVIGVPATLTYIVTGWNHEGALPGSLGYVNVIGFLCIAPLTTWFAPYGARLAHRLTRPQLSRAFGFFLLIVASRMLYNATQG
jgi:uncharacterized protein